MQRRIVSMERQTNQEKTTGIHIELEEADLREFRRLKPEYGALSHVLRGMLKAWLKREQGKRVKK
jgi:hypothetical protein